MVDLKEHEPLSRYTYMKTGGPADYLATAATTHDLVSLVTYARERQLKFLILGGGSNTIFADAGYRGLVIVNKTSTLEIDPDTGAVLADSGVATNALVNQTLAKGLSGLETFLGVPGSVGGAVYNNSHYLKEFIGDYVNRIQVINQNSDLVWLSQQDLQFAYDYSILHQTHDIVTKVEFLLSHGRNPETLLQTAHNALERRRQTQPLEKPSSGCMFQNVQDEAHTSAGFLIDQAGLKGRQIGGAQVSDIHANFIVNTGTATTQDIIDLSALIIQTVKNEFGLTLQREVFILDEYGERMNL